jgi:hypothetical protein
MLSVKSVAEELAVRVDQVEDSVSIHALKMISKVRFLPLML